MSLHKEGWGEARRREARARLAQSLAWVKEAHERSAQRSSGTRARGRNALDMLVPRLADALAAFMEWDVFVNGPAPVAASGSDGA